MNYDLTIKEERKNFIKRANYLLKNQRVNVSLKDDSNRTLNQNSYIHVLCRILAAQTGVTEAYAKQVYLKDIACRDIFVTTTKDKVTGTMVKYYRSTSDLSIPEMRKTISMFREWASENGFSLPDATIADDGSMSFSSQSDSDAYHQAVIQTSKLEDYL